MDLQIAILGEEIRNLHIKNACGDLRIVNKVSKDKKKNVKQKLDLMERAGAKGIIKLFNSVKKERPDDKDDDVIFNITKDRYTKIKGVECTDYLNRLGLTQREDIKKYLEDNVKFLTEETISDLREKYKESTKKNSKKPVSRKSSMKSTEDLLKGNYNF